MKRWEARVQRFGDAINEDVLELTAGQQSSLREFLSRLQKNPFDPALAAATESSERGQFAYPSPDGYTLYWKVKHLRADAVPTVLGDFSNELIVVIAVVEQRQE